MPKWIRARCNTDHVTGNCVEVAQLESGEVLVRSTLAPQSTVTFTVEEWRTFLVGVRQSGEFDF